ncbi:unnamed protein product [Vitrella brassicaformis CCMP3155]|uniref:t-SNARE coiled-coil homology domain-containing protein n=1 Tax=Vitrella brassicaformis (strain CCMP3155) TaxID=1169540 RepID=A0A0G4GG12_VITBC|nr:unnamed protein product [Vitrella brassicaformis CCMP3155]|eukprot:CEM28306.1 unnamed protein product [Vitrella brassicaformis CCMP3155]
MDVTDEFFRVVKRLRPGLRVAPLQPNESPFAAMSMQIMSNLVRAERLLGNMSAAGGNDAATDPSGTTAVGVIRMCKEDIQTLESVVDVHTHTHADASSAASLSAHRHGVVSCLYDYLQTLAQRLQQLEVNRMQQQLEVKRYFSGPGYRGGPVRVKNNAHMPVERSDALSYAPAAWGESTSLAVDEATQQQLSAQTQQLLNMYNTDLDALRDAQSKVSEISQLMGFFATKVAEQNELCEQIASMAGESVELMGKAGRHLSKAIQRSNSYRFYCVMFFIVASVILLVLDWIKS